MRSNIRDLTMEAAAEKLVHALGGRWTGEGAMCRCPCHEDRTPSLSVRIGDRSLLFKCFAGCETTDILRAIRRLRLSVPARRPSGAAPQSGIAHHPNAARAIAIWSESRPIGNSPGARYLAARKIALRPSSLRFHARTPLGRGSDVQFRPAIIAAIRDETGVVAVQRHFLTPRCDALALDLPKAKLMLGRPLLGAVRLSPPTQVLALAEGIESALSAQFLLGLPVWATLGSERLARIFIPEAVEQLVLLPDADSSGRLAERLARRTYGDNRRRIETLWPWHGLNDWNDVLLAEMENEAPAARVGE